MITYALMFLFILLFAGIVLWGIQYNPNKDNFFGVPDTKALRGFWCIVVILVHVPPVYSNRIQDMIGSFAYVGVTFFFMTSAYGLKQSILKKENYLNQFWIKRLPALLVPALIINLVSVIIKCFQQKQISPLSLINIDDWVKVLLLYYFIFWLVYKLPLRTGYQKDILICLIILTLSLVGKLTEWKVVLLWPTESIGFILGIVFADIIEWYQKWSNQKPWKIKTALFLVLSGVLGVAYLRFKQVYFWGDYCLKIALAIAMLLLILQIVRRFQLGNKVLLFLGGISYEVYLLHRTVLALFESLDLFENSGVYIWTSVIITCIGAMAVQFVSKRILKCIMKK